MNTRLKKYLSFLAVCLLIGLLMLLAGLQASWQVIPLLILIGGLVWSDLMNGFLWGWEKLGHVLGFINSRILLSLLYVFFITPYSLLYRRKANSYYQKSLRGTERTMFQKRQHMVQPGDFEKSW